MPMPDFTLMGQAGLAAGAVAAAVLLMLVWPRGSPSPARSALGWTLGVGLGFFVGCGVLGVWPAWPPIGDRDRFLTLVLPAAILIEGLAAFGFVPSWLAWLLRCLLAALVTPILLHGTIYLEDAAGPGTREWPLRTAITILAGVAGILV